VRDYEKALAQLDIALRYLVLCHKHIYRENYDRKYKQRCKGHIRDDKDILCHITAYRAQQALEASLKPESKQKKPQYRASARAAAFWGIHSKISSKLNYQGSPVI
jgi:hypothetical protein